MDPSIQVLSGVSLIALLLAAALRFGVSDALEGLYLTFVLVHLRMARSALRALRIVAAWLFRSR